MARPARLPCSRLEPADRLRAGDGAGDQTGDYSPAGGRDPRGQDSVRRKPTPAPLPRPTAKRDVPPYNDPFVIGGQGTIAMELIEQLPDLDAVFVAVGGGGLIRGRSSLI